MSREMKDSGIEWIGEIPKEWDVCEGKRLYLSNDGGVWGDDPTGENDTIVLRSTEQSIDGKLLIKSPAFRHLSTSEKSFAILKKGDLIITKSSGSISHIGKTSIINEDIEQLGCCYSNFLQRLRISGIANYFWYVFNSVIVKSQFDYISTTTIGINNINSKMLNTLLFTSPPLSEQQAIADFLDIKCGEIDDMIALQEKMIEELKAYKQSVITEAVTKGLNPNVPMRDSGIDWIGDLPQHWSLMPIKYFKSRSKNAFVDGPFGSNLKSSHYVDHGDVYVIESGFITTGKFIYKPFKTITLEHFKTIERSSCTAYDIIIAKIGANYGMAGELPKLDKPCVVSGNSLKITLDNKIILNSIFVYLMMTAKCNGGFNHFVQENAQPALSLSGLNNFRMPIPPLSEQQEIADFLDKKCSDIDALIAIKQEKIDSLKEYKKSLIYEYVTGKKEIN